MQRALIRAISIYQVFGLLSGLPPNENRGLCLYYLNSGSFFVFVELYRTKTISHRDRA